MLLGDPRWVAPYLALFRPDADDDMSGRGWCCAAGRALS
jgi:hypothetical protein